MSKKTKKKNKRVYKKSTKKTAKKMAKKAAKRAAKKAAQKAAQNVIQKDGQKENSFSLVANESSNTTPKKSTRKKHIFGISLLIYVFLLLFSSCALWYVLWNKLNAYQNSYELAKAAANPDLVVVNYLDMFAKENISDLVTDEWDEINKYETSVNINDFISSNVENDIIDWKRRDDYTDFKPKYDIYSSDNYLGAIALKQKSAVDNYGFHMCEIDHAEIGFVPENLSSITIKAYDGTQIFVNDTLLADACIQKTPLNDSMYVEASNDTGTEYFISTYELNGFFDFPSVRIERDGYICEMDITDDNEYHRTFEQTCMIDENMLSEISDRALEIAKAYDYYAAGIREIGGMAQYFLHSGKGYRTLAGLAFDISIAGATTTYDILSAETGNLLVYSDDAVVIDTHQTIHRVHRRIEYDENIDVRWYLTKIGGRWYVKDFSMRL